MRRGVSSPHDEQRSDGRRRSDHSAHSCLTKGNTVGKYLRLSNLSYFLQGESRALCASDPINPNRINNFRTERGLHPRVSSLLSPGPSHPPTGRPAAYTGMLYTGWYAPWYTRGGTGRCIYQGGVPGSIPRVVYTGVTLPYPRVYIQGVTLPYPRVYKGCTSHTRVYKGCTLIPGCTGVYPS